MERDREITSHSGQGMQLLSDVQLFNDGTVALNVHLSQVVEQVSSVTDHFQKAAAAVKVLMVILQMGVEVVDAVGKNRNLNLRGACVAFVRFVLVDNCLFDFFFHDFSPFLHVKFASAQRSAGEMPKRRTGRKSAQAGTQGP